MLRNVLFICMALALIAAPAVADITISGHLVTVYSDAQTDELVNATGVANNVVVPTATNGVLASPLSSNALGFGGVGGAGAPRFGVSEVELDINADVTDNISAQIDLEFAPAGALGVEQAYVKLVQPWDVPFDVIVGKFNAPIGSQAYEALDRKFITDATTFAFLPTNFTGIAFQGTANAFDYVIYYVNNAAFGDNNTNANSDGSNAIGGRIATSPMEGLDIGVSYLQESLTDVTVQADPAKGDADLTIWNIDANYVSGPWLIQGDYSSIEEETSHIGGDAELDVWSVLVAYDVDDQINVAIRYGEVDPNRTGAIGGLTLAPDFVRAAQALDYDVISYAATYSFSENAKIKVEYSDYDSNSVGDVSTTDPDDNLFAAQLVVAF